MSSVFELFAKLFLDTSEYENTLKDVSTNTDGIGSKLSNGLATAAKVGTAALAATGAAMTTWGTKAVKTGESFDKSMSQVAATMGLTNDEMAQRVGSVSTMYGDFEGNLREYAQFMGANTAFSASQAADALNYMALAGYDVQTSLEMLPNVLNLAAAGGIDLAYASDMITDNQSALGLSLDETTELVDKMAKASSKSNTSVAQLGEAFLSVGGTAKVLKGGTTEAATALGILADNGIKGSEGGRALRNIILSLTAPTDQANLALENLGVSTFDTEGKMRNLDDILSEFAVSLDGLNDQERQEALSTIFNRVDLKSVQALVSGVRYSYDDLGQSLADAGVKLESFTNFQGSNIDMTELARITIAQYAEGGEEGYQRLITMGQSWGLSQEEAINYANAASEALGQQGNRWDELSGYIDNAAGAAGQMANTQLNNLWGDMTLFQSATEGAMIAVSDKLTPTLREFVDFGTRAMSELTAEMTGENGMDGVMAKLGEILAEGVTMILEKAPEIASAALSLVGSFITTLAEKAPELIQSGLDMLVEVSQGAVDGLPNLIATVTPMVIAFVGKIVENLPKILNAGIEILLNILQGIVNSLPTLISYIPEIIAGIISVITNSLPSILKAGIRIIIMLLQGIIISLPALIDQFPKLVDKIINIITETDWVQVGKDIIDTIKEGVTNLANAIPDKVKEIIGKAVTMITEISWLGIGKDIITKIVDGLKELFSDIPNKLKEIGDDAFSKITNIDWGSLGGNIIDGIKGGLSGAASSLASAAQSAAQSAYNAACRWLGIASPSKRFRDGVGKMMAYGLNEGFVDNIDTDGMVQSVSKAVKGIEGVNAPLISPYSNGETNNIGSSPVTINVYARQDQNEKDVAREVQRQLIAWDKQRRAVWA